MKFFLNTDEKINEMAGFKFPETWWSRPYEYAWAMRHLDKDDIVMDFGCGIEHPFKTYAANNCKMVHAIDYDDNIAKLSPSKTLTYHIADHQDIDTIFEPGTFDKIFCISVLEHMKAEIPQLLRKFKRLLKPGGKIILTMDYPAIDPNRFKYFAETYGLVFREDFDRTIPDDAVGIGLMRCLHTVLEKI